eukprot:366009-Chlamydomonas_euryale.AAC.31
MHSSVYGGKVQGEGVPVGGLPEHPCSHVRAVHAHKRAYAWIQQPPCHCQRIISTMPPRAKPPPPWRVHARTSRQAPR